MSNLPGSTLGDPQLDWQGPLPRSQRFGDGYFSGDGLEETRHVFLNGNQLAERLARCREFTIIETGFGTGLNLLATWQLWRRVAPGAARLHFVSVEGFPLERGELARAHRAWPELAELAHRLRAVYPPVLEPGFHHLQPVQRLTLTLLLGEVGEILPRLAARADAWLLDGFAPARNPAMWSEALFGQMARLTRPGGTFATFTAAGKVRRGLMAAGFTVEKAPGFGPKREMLRGRFDHPPQSVSSTPWLAVPAYQGPRRAAVIGAGLAGSATALSLARRGFAVILVERHPGPAREGSGNPAGVVMPQLAGDGPGGDWYGAGYRFTRQLLEALRDPPPAWFPRGLLAAAWDRRSHQRLARLAEHPGILPGPLHWLEAGAAGEIAGIALPWPALYLPQAGWADPRDICRTLLIAAGPNLETRYGRQVASLERWQGQWRLLAKDGGEITRAPLVVVAGGREAISLDQTRDLPLIPVRGQISRASPGSLSGRLKAVLTGPAYLTPAQGGRHTLGATFDPEDDDIEVRAEDHIRNLAALERFVPQLARELADRIESGRAALRAASPDHLPLVGPVPDLPAAGHCYRDLQLGRRPQDYPSLPCQPGLWITTGHGSRGLVSAPLAGEWLGAMICNEPWPVGLELLAHLHPVRFLVRQLRRGGG